jgi:hypothetical protein
MGEVIKIGFVGTSCVGKSTLLGACYEQLGSQIIFAEEAAREFFTAHPEVTERFAVGAQGQVQDLALQKEITAHKRADELGQAVILCDRSVLDAPVYVYSQGDERGAKKLLDKVSPWLRSYNQLYLLDPTDVPYAADAIRDEDESTRQLFHDAFLDYFTRYKIPFRLLSGSVEERVNQVADFVVRQKEM